jgi:RNA polymerase sigma factor (sigma-70 family)
MTSFEGLVFRTSRMYAAQVKKDPDDLAQELRIRVWKAISTYDPERSRTSLESYVFSVVQNKIKDYKRDAARAAGRPVVLHIEDMQLGGKRTNNDVGSHAEAKQELFDRLFNRIEAETVYAEVDDRYQLPSTVTEPERQVLMLLAAGCSRDEIVGLLGVTRGQVDGMVRVLREKLAHLKPSGDE